MKTHPISIFMAQEEHQLAAGRILRDAEGLVCFPCSGTYRLAASLRSEEAVLQLLQSKRRSKHRPALIMVSDMAMLEEVAEQIPAPARGLISALWPGNVTMRLRLRADDLPRKVYKELSKLDKKVGVRLPANPVAEALLKASGVPLLVSSANRSKKGGAASVAAIKQTFSRSVAMFVDSGDLPARPPSTILDFDAEGQYQLVRDGAVAEEAIQQAWNSL